MCWLALVPVALAAVSSFQQANASKKQNEYQAAVASNNAQVAEWQANDAIQRGNVAATNERRKGQQQMGTQRAAMAAAGLDVSTGSALSILEDTDYFNQTDQQTIRSSAAREAYGYRVQGSNAQAAANLYSSTANGINPLFEGVKSGAGAYYTGGLGGRAPANDGTTLTTASTAVNPKWYSGSPSNANYG